MIVYTILTERNLSVQKLADQIERSRSRVAYMLGQRGATWGNIEKLAAALGVAPEDIAERTTLPSHPRTPYGIWRD